ncbi:TRAP transporter large permease [Aquicoccus porphyridii]|uniref:TRAP transporter large permease protein n=1 Tax=Aquicoccus porphyridii TaxID=1852029 RepID=A0A5A9ZCH6_9RHOB|nr:TRAP transporter large permease [Aquicoccus porphyridii]KAA0914937.1 TRAP transporter large permease [Aquicoccus porphyridii]RAI52519.1 TRAP transporter large permease [Rhodobacteraceae bacterium AsT-22]
MVWIVLLVVALAAILSGVAISYVAGAAAVMAFVLTDHAAYLGILPQRIFSQIDVFTFLAMPLFILAGDAMTRGGVTRVLIDLAMLIVGRFKGGLGYVNISSSVFLAGISGSAVADAAATTNTLVPAMKEQGYRADFAAALTAASCVIGPIIPPSIVMIFYGALMNVSVAALFAGGIVPGLLMAVFLFAYNFWIARRDDHPGGVAPVGAALATILRALPALAIPVTIVAGIVFGVVTPTEAAGIAVAITVVLVFAYALVDRGGIGAALRTTATLTSASVERTVMLTGSIFMILFAAAVFGYLMGILRVPEQIAAMVQNAGLTSAAYLLLASAVMFLAGMVMDVTMALVLLVPVLIPAAIAGGADPVHVGVVSCLNLTLGLISPPFGGCLMVISAASGVNYLRLSLAILPFLAVQVVLLILLILLPELTLALPRALGLVQ